MCGKDLADQAAVEGSCRLTQGQPPLGSSHEARDDSTPSGFRCEGTNPLQEDVSSYGPPTRYHHIGNELATHEPREDAFGTWHSTTCILHYFLLDTRVILNVFVTEMNRDSDMFIYKFYFYL